MKIILIIAILTGCSGYKLRSKKNPFSQYGISSLSIPMFHNFSNLPNASAIFTKEIFNSMLDYRELTVRSGFQGTDAVLVGIIESGAKKKNTIITDSQKEVSNIYGEDFIGEGREDLILPTSNRMRLNLRVVIIKHPTKEELDFLKTSIAKDAMGSKIIFNETIALNGRYNLREILGENDAETRRNIQVLGTQNRGVQQESLKSLAQKAASSFEDMILYAF